MATMSQSPDHPPHEQFLRLYAAYEMVLHTFVPSMLRTRELANEDDHVTACSRAACATIERYQSQPFFLYIAYRVPYVPLDAPKKYLDRFPGSMSEHRRQALAMLSAVDDGVGMALDTLEKHSLRENTLIFYIADNGAPLKINIQDTPDLSDWDGSLNDPLNGEKGMLTEGGIRVPFLISWPRKIPARQVYPPPVSSLNVAATAVAQAGSKRLPVNSMASISSHT